MNYPKIKIYLTSLIVFTMLASQARAAVVFEDNFDNSPDWHSAETPTNGVGFPQTWKDYSVGCGSTCPPQNWTAYRAQHNCSNNLPNIGEHIFNLEASAHRGLSGKGIANYIESNADCGSDNWNGGGLDVFLGYQGYQELFIRFWLRYDQAGTGYADWQFTPPGGSGANGGQEKVIRIARWNQEPLTPSSAFTNYDVGLQNNNPVAFFDWYNSNVYNTPTVDGGYAWIHLFAGRNSPDYDLNFYNKNVWNFGGPSQGYDTFKQQQNAGNITIANNDPSYWVTDGQWHMMEMRVKMNSAPGVADGEYEAWMDSDNLLYARHYLQTGLAWASSTGSVVKGWNHLTFLDNIRALNDLPVDALIRRDMDDVVVYTSLSSGDPLWSQSPQDGRLPLNYVVGNAASPAYSNSDFVGFLPNWLKAGIFSSDLNNDGFVNSKDVGIMMSKWQ